MTAPDFGPEYHKIQTLYKRDIKNRIVVGDWALPEFQYLKDLPWRWTEKVDGTNIRIHWDGERVTIGGRTDNAQIPTFLLAAIQPLLTPEKFRVIFADCTDATLYGEGYGPKIQKGGGNYRTDPGLILFDVRVGHWWLQPEAVQDIGEKFDLGVVPQVEIGTLEWATTVMLHNRVKSHWPKVEIEGLVGTPTVPLFTRRGDRIIAKIKVRDFDYLREDEPHE